MTKKFFKCVVCADIHIGETAPDICPSCAGKDIYLPILESDARKAMDIPQKRTKSKVKSAKSKQGKTIKKAKKRKI